MASSQFTNLVLFDGVCNLCNGFVQFLLRHDRFQRLTFGSLQSEEAQRLLYRASTAAGNPTTDARTAFTNGGSPALNSIIYLRHGQIYTRSTAVLWILRDLGGWWRLCGILAVVPRFIQDSFYDWVARNRYRWTGKRAQCMIPDPTLASRFL